MGGRPWYECTPEEYSTLARLENESQSTKCDYLPTLRNHPLLKIPYVPSPNQARGQVTINNMVIYGDALSGSYDGR